MVLPLLLTANSAAADTGGNLTVRFTGLRSAKGMIRACLTQEQRFFLTCDKDPNAIRANVAAGPDARVRFHGVVSGDYALAVMHDENGNGRLDVMMGIPREGVGFSRNPAFHFGPPKFSAARFTIGAGDAAQEVRIKYFL
ncbi:MAG: DUF2141 domain-containing protein [Sphingobium sp.]